MPKGKAVKLTFFALCSVHNDHDINYFYYVADQIQTTCLPLGMMICSCKFKVNCWLHLLVFYVSFVCTLTQFKQVLIKDQNKVKVKADWLCLSNFCLVRLTGHKGIVLQHSSHKLISFPFFWWLQNRFAKTGLHHVVFKCPLTVCFTNAWNSNKKN